MGTFTKLAATGVVHLFPSRQLERTMRVRRPWYGGPLEVGKGSENEAEQPVNYEVSMEACEQKGWRDNQSFRNIVSWVLGKPRKPFHNRDQSFRREESGTYSYAPKRYPRANVPHRRFASAERYSPGDGTEAVGQGLCVELDPWAFNYMSVPP